jgi:hypothetical protein
LGFAASLAPKAGLIDIPSQNYGFYRDSGAEKRVLGSMIFPGFSRWRDEYIGVAMGQFRTDLSHFLWAISSTLAK